ncbi:MAG: BatD family protein, partial [bacterium]
MKQLRYWVFVCVSCYGIACWASFAQAPAGPVDESTPSKAVPLDRTIEVFTRFVPESDFRVGEAVTFEVVVRWLDLGERLSTRLAEAPSFENFEPLSSSTRSSAQSTEEGRRMEEVYSFRLVPHEEGSAQVGDVDVIYRSLGEEENRLSAVACYVTVGPERKSYGRLLLLVA